MSRKVFGIFHWNQTLFSFPKVRNNKVTVVYFRMISPDFQRTRVISRWKSEESPFSGRWSLSNVIGFRNTVVDTSFVSPSNCSAFKCLFWNIILIAGAKKKKSKWYFTSFRTWCFFGHYIINSSLLVSLKMKEHTSRELSAWNLGALTDRYDPSAWHFCLAFSHKGRRIRKIDGWQLRKCHRTISDEG